MAEAARPTMFTGLNATGQNVSNGEISVVKVIGSNTSAATAFIQIFDMAAADVVLGTTVARYTITLAANTGYEALDFFPADRFVTRMSVFSTTTQTGNTGSAAGVSLQAWIN